jgi:hypothetical protein
VRKEYASAHRFLARLASGIFLTGLQQGFHHSVSPRRFVAFGIDEDNPRITVVQGMIRTVGKLLSAAEKRNGVF